MYKMAIKNVSTCQTREFDTYALQRTTIKPIKWAFFMNYSRECDVKRIF